jgi:hypothetical protein
MSRIPEKKITLIDKKNIISILSCITEGEFEEIFTRCEKAIEHRLWYTEYGAHSEKELGEPAKQYYIKKALEKIYTYEWYWDYENVPLVKHIITIANSLISNQLDKYKRKQNREETKVSYNDELYYDVFDEVYDDKIDLLIDCIEHLVANVEDLNFYWEAIKEGKAKGNC